jgi:hypothetical protein
MQAELPPPLADLAASRDGVLRTRELVAHLSTGTVRAQLAARRWQRAGRSVVALHNGPLTDAQLVWAALLQAPPGSAVSGPTAMALDGVVDRLASGVHVTLPCGQRRPAGLHAHVHWSAFLGDADVSPAGGPRRTRLPRSVLDWAAWQGSDAAARTVVLLGMQSRRVSEQQLLAALPSRGPCRHHAVIVESIDDAVGGVASVPEARFRDLVVRAGLPRPTHQAVRVRPSGRYFLDAEWAEYRLTVEIQGVHHFEVRQREEDLDRQNDLVVEGESLLQFTSFALRHREAVVVGTLRRALYKRGWWEGAAA